MYVSTHMKNNFSFKKRYSVTNKGLIGHNTRFLWAAFGVPGTTHDSRLLKSCDIYDKIEKGLVLANKNMILHEYGAIPFTTVGDSSGDSLLKLCESISLPLVATASVALVSVKTGSKIIKHSGSFIGAFPLPRVALSVYFLHRSFSHLYLTLNLRTEVSILGHLLNSFPSSKFIFDCSFSKISSNFTLNTANNNDHK